jgi:steroid delta-isomerase-like uncharacterized protein
MSARELVNAYFRAFNKRDARAVCALFGKTGTYKDAATPSALKGEALNEYLRGHYAAFPDGRYRLTRAVDGRNGLIGFEWRFIGTHAGPLGSIAATNRAVDIRGSSMAQAKRGKIAWLRGYYDRRAMFKQLGI